MRSRYILPELSYEQMIEKVNIGDNTSLVTEILRFTTDDKLLNPSKPFDLNYSVITDHDQAKELAYYAVTSEETGHTWANIIEHETSEVSALTFYNDISMLDDVIGEMFYELEKRLGRGHRDLEQIYSDLWECISARALIGRQHKFLEEIFAIYQRGCWPCGWEGDYPDGKIIVYQPPIVT